MTGKLLFPGFIDAHTHFDLDVCNTTTADNFDTGTRSAIHGGTTLVIDFACPNKGESLQYGLDLWHKKADGRSTGTRPSAPRSPPCSPPASPRSRCT